jgi:DNA-binding MarR family transcriptional regulator
VAGAAVGGAAAVGLRLVVEQVRLRRLAERERDFAREAAIPLTETIREGPPVRVEVLVVPPEPLVATTPLPRAIPAADEPLRTSQRVILHILGQGRIGPNELAPVGLSQGGIGDALHVRQSSVAKSLARLEAAGVLVVSRRHVEHQVRRLKVYELTPLGEALARDLRRRTMKPANPSLTRDGGPIWLGR